MKKILLASVALFAIVSGPAMAADLPVRPVMKAPPVMVAVYNWTGFYIGANGGGAWAHKCFTFVPVVGLPVPEGCHDGTGGVAGGQVGFNWQTGPVVLGVEFQGDWASLSGSNVSLAFPLTTNRTRINSIFDVTGRVGYAWDAALLYVKGGGAWVRDRYDNRVTLTGVLNDSATETRSGWVIGVGFEYGFTPNWSVGVEYDHFDFGTRNVSFFTPAGVFAVNDRVRQDVDMVKAKLNWRFGWGGPVVARY
jgi:outer membrane immunogenic protein